MSEKDGKNYLIITVFCAFFLVIRLLQPHNFSHDEAEQYLNASQFFAGFNKQPPLYSWALWAFSKLFGLNLLSLSVFKYLIFGAFLASFYKLTRCFFAEEKSFIATNSLMLFITYVFDFNRDLTHTILLSLFAVLSFYLYICLLKNPSSINYIFFGLSLAGGFLAKYNFVFIASAIALTCFFTRKGREAFFKLKSFLTLASFSFALSPHLLWLKEQKFVGFDYAMKRGDQAVSLDFLAILKSLFAGYYELILVFFVLVLLWFSFYKRSNDELRTTVNLAAIFAMLLPMLVVIIFGFNSFYAKWLASIYFLPVLAFFLNLELDKQVLREKIQYGIAIALIVFVASYKLIGVYQPDLVGKPKNILYPYKEVFVSLKDKLQDFEPDQIVFVTSQRELLRANLTQQQKHFMPDAQVIKKSALNQEHQGKIKILVWKNPQQEMQAKLPKSFKKLFPNAQSQELIEKPLINSEKYTYKLAWAISHYSQ